MYCIENYKNIEKIFVKKSNYITLISDDTIFLKNICEALHFYFSEKRISADKKLSITNFLTGEKEQISSMKTIFLEDNSLDEEISMGAKTELYLKCLAYFKEKISIEPSLLTLNSLIDDFFLEEVTQKFESSLSKFSDSKIKFIFNEFTPADIIKKIDFKFYKNEEGKEYENISNLEKIKIKLSIFDVEENKNKIYIFYYPENFLSIPEIKELKKFLKTLEINNQIFIATSSKYLLDNNLDTINIFCEEKLKNFLKEEELLEKLLEEYPKLEEKEKILSRIRYLIPKFCLDFLEVIKITNKQKNEIEEIFLENFEDIFLILYFLKLSNLKYEIDLVYNNDCVFSNYIKHNF